MCDYSLHHVASRPAKVGDKLVMTKFESLTRGFTAIGEPNVAVCLLPGTEVAFEKEMEMECDHAFGRLLPSMRFGKLGDKIWTAPTCITMRWNSPTGRSCWSPAFAKASMRPYCSCRPPRGSRATPPCKRAVLSLANRASRQAGLDSAAGTIGAPMAPASVEGK
jgi:hypothetical protein